MQLEYHAIGDIVEILISNLVIEEEYEIIFKVPIYM